MLRTKPPSVRHPISARSYTCWRGQHSLWNWKHWKNYSSKCFDKGYILQLNDLKVIFNIKLTWVRKMARGKWVHSVAECEFGGEDLFRMPSEGLSWPSQSLRSPGQPILGAIAAAHELYRACQQAMWWTWFLVAGFVSSEHQCRQSLAPAQTRRLTRRAMPALDAQHCRWGQSGTDLSKLN